MRNPDDTYNGVSPWAEDEDDAWRVALDGDGLGDRYGDGDLHPLHTDADLWVDFCAGYDGPINPPVCETTIRVGRRLLNVTFDGDFWAIYGEGLSVSAGTTIHEAFDALRRQWPDQEAVPDSRFSVESRNYQKLAALTSRWWAAWRRQRRADFKYEYGFSAPHGRLPGEGVPRA